MQTLKFLYPIAIDCKMDIIEASDESTEEIMENKIKVARKEVKSIIEATFPEYSGRKIGVVFTDTVSLYDLNWSGGTCNKYAALSTDGKVAHPHIPAPWSNPFEGQSVNVPENAVIVEHSYFCGHDCGITIYANPAQAPKWITA